MIRNPDKPIGGVRRGFTMAEAVMASAIIAFLVVAALNAAGASGLAQYHTGERATARFLADGLMAEILSLAYEEPDGCMSMGLDADELSTNKINYDDVDDYKNWTESPPQDRSGTALNELAGWTRTVNVVWINPNNANDVLSSETGAKRIQVTVKHNGIVVATRVAIRTKAP
ncbi:MAG: type IV pilus modification PilV family protein [Bacillota bacterium]